MVVANTVAAFAQISETKGYSLLQLTPTLVNKLLSAMNECNEWGIIYILDAIVSYVPPTQKETELYATTVTTSHAHLL